MLLFVSPATFLSAVMICTCLRYSLSRKSLFYQLIVVASDIAQAQSKPLKSSSPHHHLLRTSCGSCAGSPAPMHFELDSRHLVPYASGTQVLTMLLQTKQK